MWAARGSSRLGWAASALAAVAVIACQPPVAPTATPNATPNAAPTLPTGIEPQGATQQATVTDVVDGDTIHVEIDGQEFRVRYIGLDAPEIAHDTNPGEPFGVEATQANAALVDGQLVILEKDVSDTDQFGRLLRYVWLGGPGTWLLVNAELAYEGMADVKAYPPDTARQAELQSAEDAAMSADLGIWAN